ncbi:hypothetical protein BDN67DRAFT_1015544 [Paxillus ammoniavirescens]|nr:hypothetical protein BDN67DRAFT_1015544 [Paxillus ammoniavirescens]
MGIGSSFSIGYALDSYKDMNGEVMMAVILVPNTSFAINILAPAAFVGLAITVTFLIVIKGRKS